MDRLIKRAIRGNRKAQNEFYDQFSGLVMGVCARYIRDEDEAADVFQEAFIRIFQNLRKLNDPAAIHGWIKRIVVNTALDHLRGLSFHNELMVDDHELSDQFYSNLLDKLSIEGILEVVDRLPDGYRIVFNMHVIDGYSHKEIAEKIRISESTSRSQLTHARKLLKKYLNELGITRYEQVI